MNKIKKMNTLDELLAEKAKLQVLCKEKEKEIGNKLDYIQDNLGIIALETFLPSNQTDKNTVSQVLDGLISLIQTFIPSLGEKFNQSEKWIKIIEIVASSIFSRFFNKKSV
jgi:hypothetical protein